MTDGTKIYRSLLFCLFLIVLFPSIIADTLIINVPYPDIEKVGNATRVTIEDYGSTADMYRPQLPAKTFYYQIPAEAKQVKVKPVQMELHPLGIHADIERLAPAMPLVASAEQQNYTPPAPIPMVHAAYPEIQYRHEIKVFDSHKLVAVTIYPVQHYPSDGRLFYIPRYEFDIFYAEPASAQPTENPKESKASATQQLAADMIVNHAQSAEDESQATRLEPEASPGSYPVKYAIITTEALSSSLIPLKEWKTQKGIPAQIYTVEDITTNYSGADTPEKIRNFLISMESSHDLDWVLLAGDQADVPARNAYCDDTWAADGYLVPTDYYYADLQGNYSPYNWNLDNDSNYGEPEDDIDWLPEVYVGRLSTSSNTTMAQLVQDIIDYETNPPSGNWTSKVILAGAKSDDSTDEALLMEYVRTDLLGSRDYDRLYYLTTYTRDYLLSFANLESRLDLGASLVNIAGHGSYTGAYVTSTGSAFMSTSTNPTNSDMKPFVYADACYTGGFDQASSLAEDVITTWGIGYIGASRVSFYAIGWASPNHPWNQAMDYRFFEQLLSEGKYRAGQAFYDSKVDYINDFSPVYGPEYDYASRKNFLAYNLLGDPELGIYTVQPGTFIINTTDNITAGAENLIKVTVTNSSGAAVENATVCLYDGDDYHAVGTTGATGIAWFNVTTVRNVTVTVSKAYYVASQENITAAASGSAPNISSISASASVYAVNITWTTDLLSNSTVYYGLASGIYPNTDTNSTSTLSHRVAISGLNASSTYFYIASSCNAEGCTNASVANFTTMNFNITAVSATTTNESASISATTNGAATCNGSYGNTTTLGIDLNCTGNQTDHNCSLTGLVANTTYHFNLTCADVHDAVSVYTGNFTTADTKPEENTTDPEDEPAGGGGSSSEEPAVNLNSTETATAGTASVIDTAKTGFAWFTWYQSATGWLKSNAIYIGAGIVGLIALFFLWKAALSAIFGAFNLVFSALWRIIEIIIRTLVGIVTQLFRLGVTAAVPFGTLIMAQAASPIGIGVIIGLIITIFIIMKVYVL